MDASRRAIPGVPYAAWGSALFAAVVLPALWFVGRPAGAPLGFPLDDAWIHMVYGRNVAEQGMIAYNPGEPTTGATSILWALLLGLVHKVLGSGDVDRLVVAVVLLGGALHVACAAQAARLAGRLGGLWAAWTAGLIVAVSPQLAVGALSGMEVPLAALLFLTGLDLLCAQAWLAAGIVLGLAPLARPELAPAACVAVLGIFLWQRPRDAAETARRLLQLGLPALLLGTWQLWRNWTLTEHLLPATYYGKLGLNGPFQFSWVGRALFDTLSLTPPLWGALGWLSLTGLARRTGDRRVWLVLGAALAYLMANLRVVVPHDPRVFYGVRYLLPIVPPLTVVFAVGCVGLGDMLSPRLRRLPLVLLLLLSLAGTALTFRGQSWKLANDTRNMTELQVAAGKWLAEHLAAGLRVASNDAGGVRYFDNHWTLDMMGLNTPDMLWHAKTYTRAHPVAAIVFMPAWFLPHPTPELRLVWDRSTQNYTATGIPAMARQWIMTCEEAPDHEPHLQDFDGTRIGVELWCQKP